MGTTGRKFVLCRRKARWMDVKGVNGALGRRFKPCPRNRKTAGFVRNQRFSSAKSYGTWIIIFYAPHILTHKRKGNNGVDAILKASAPLFRNFSDFILQEAAHLCGGFPLHCRGDVGVGVQGEASAVMAQHLGNRFDVYPVLDGQCGKVWRRSWSGSVPFRPASAPGGAYSVRCPARLGRRWGMKRRIQSGHFLSSVWLDLVLDIAQIGLMRRWAYIHFAVALKPDKNVLGKTQAEVKEKLKKALEQCREVDNPYRFS